MKNANEYEAVKEYKVLKSYLEKFRKVSIDNDIPGLLSFFVIQGQVALPYLRIPWDDSYMDPRVHVFWIQSSRTGKSVAFDYIAKIAKGAGVKTKSYTTGTDSGMIGSVDKDEQGKKERKEGLLAGQKILNFDEGSIILNPGKNAEETALYLQQALNAVGTQGNILSKPMKEGVIEFPSWVSLWITTYPPKGVKQFVLERGIFQRVLLCWAYWGLDKRQNVSQIRMSRLYKQSEFKDTHSVDQIIEHFTDLNEKLMTRVTKLTGISDTQWKELSSTEYDDVQKKHKGYDNREDLIQDIMFNIFTIDDTYEPAIQEAVARYYDRIYAVAPALQEVVCSFLPSLEDYTAKFANHMAMLEGTWTLTGKHVDMSVEILYDQFEHLLQWLESEVEVGKKQTLQKTIEINMKKAFKSVVSNGELSEVNGTPGWVKQQDILKTYAKITGYSSKPTLLSHMKKSEGLFTKHKVGNLYYIKLVEGV